MWISWRGRRSRERRGGAAALLFAAALAGACGQVDAPGTSTQSAEAAPAATGSAAAATTAAEPQTVADIFPPGPQREAVMNNCGSCHNLACAAIGQRSAERWDALEEGHKDKMSGDLDAMFEYLKANFDATKPEPKVPARFLEGGCTPF